METSTHLNNLRARLIRAQRAENEAIRKLNELTSLNRSDKARFKQLLDAVQAARERSLVAYNEWNQAIRALQHADGSLGEARPIDYSAFTYSARTDGSPSEEI